MARYAFERLSAQDLTFLLAESDTAPMHVGAVAVLDIGKLANESGGVDFARYRRALESVLHWIPRYRQKLAWVPLDRWPVWIDDRHFDIGYHVRHLALPRPGTLAQLKELASRILGRRLDPSRPLWEIWLVEGVEGGEQFALINKIHHCMIDGAAGADLTRILFSPVASEEIPEPLPYLPRQEPTSLELLGDAVRERAALPARALSAARSAVDAGPAAGAKALRNLRAVADLARWALRPPSQTPINGELSPHRRFDWLTMPLEDVRELRRELGCTVNDIVLASVAGGLRRYLFRRRVALDAIDFRVSAPVNMRRPDERGRGGNRVSSWVLRLPLDETDPLARVAAIRASTEELKRSHASQGVEVLMRAAEWLPARLLQRGVGLASAPVNAIVTNVPGPQMPLYSVGARLLGLYPVVPLIPGAGLGIALFSYEGKLCWGFGADYELIPDLATLVDDLRVGFEDLREATVANFLERRTGSAPEEPAAGEEPGVASDQPEEEAYTAPAVGGAAPRYTRQATGISSTKVAATPSAVSSRAT